MSLEIGQRNCPQEEMSTGESSYSNLAGEMSGILLKYLSFLGTSADVPLNTTQTIMKQQIIKHFLVHS